MSSSWAWTGAATRPVRAPAVTTVAAARRRVVDRVEVVMGIVSFAVGGVRGQEEKRVSPRKPPSAQPGCRAAGHRLRPGA